MRKMKKLTALLIACAMIPAYAATAAEESAPELPEIASEEQIQMPETETTLTLTAAEGGVSEALEALKADILAATGTAEDPTVVTLAGDITEMATDDIITISANQYIKLDMAGHSITVAPDFAGRPFVNKGTLTVIGNGTIDSSNSPTGGYGAINNKGTLTIENGTFRGALYGGGSSIRNTGSNAVLTVNGGTFDGSACAVYNEGTATLKGGNFISKSCSTCAAEDGHAGTWSYALQNCAESSKMYVYDGVSVTGTQGAISAAIGYLEVNGGRYETVNCDRNHGAVFYALYAAGGYGEVQCVINDGTFIGGKRYAVYLGNDNTNGDGGINAAAISHIYGGTFIAPEGVSALFVSPKTAAASMIHGGTYSMLDTATQSYIDPATALVEGEGGVVKVVAKEVVAQIGETKYYSLEEALASEEAGTIKLLANTESNTQKINKNIDLGGFALTLTNLSRKSVAADISNGTLNFKAKGDIGLVIGGDRTMTGVVVNAPEDNNSYGMIYIDKPNSLTFVNSEVNLANNASGAAIMSDIAGGKLILDNTKIVLDNTCRGLMSLEIDIKNGSEVTIKNCVDNSMRNVWGVIDGSVLTVTGGENGIKNSNQKTLTVQNGSKVSITGATGTSTEPPHNVWLKDNTDIKVDDTSTFEMGDDGNVESGSHIYTIVAQNARTGEKFYTVNEALVNANADDTIQIIADTDEAIVIPLKSVTVEGVAKEGVKPVLTGGMEFARGNVPDGTKIVIKGLHFDKKCIRLTGWTQTTTLEKTDVLTIEDNKFTNVEGENGSNAYAIHINNSDNGIKGLSIINNEFDNNKIGAFYATVCGTAVITGNTITNSGMNAGWLSGKDKNGNVADIITVSNNTFTNWGTSGEGRAMRMEGFGAGTVLNMSNNAYIHTAAPEEYVKITKAENINKINFDNCYWGGLEPTKGAGAGINIYYTPNDHASEFKAMTYYKNYENGEMTELAYTSDVVAKIGENVYTALADAFAAINAAPGTEVVTMTILPGTFAPTANEQLRVERANVIIEGAGVDNTTLALGEFSCSGQAGILLGADNITLKNLTVTSNAAGGVSAVKATYLGQETGKLIENCVLENLNISSEKGHGLNIHGVNGAAVTNVTVGGAKCAVALANAMGVTIADSTLNGNWGDIGM
uniref:Right handed beta helix domain-containing protein n=1 Tax=uncultured Bacillota bacterium TaxID=344338 RepID=A0A650EMZ5_9FIRM|nr:hypothetical protein Firmicute1046_0990 [uncultured Firmicutes bacterium]